MKQKFKVYAKCTFALVAIWSTAGGAVVAKEGGFLNSLFGNKGYQGIGEGQQTYTEECSVCHMAYPAPLLPQAKWTTIMSNLGEHFGDNAELDDSTQDTITQYLSVNASDAHGDASKLSRFAHHSQPTNSLRITDLGGFKSKHHGINKTQMVTNNPDVGSFSQCTACHGDKAQKGIFSEHSVMIPNFAGWDD